MKYLDVCMVALAMLHNAAASTPSADRLLDRFAVNADLYQESFVTHVETDRVILSPAAGQDEPQKRREHTQVVFWWDGQRMREQRYTWGDFAMGTIDRAHARYESHLFEVDKSVSYFRSGDASEEGFVTYYAGSTPKGSVFDRVTSGAGSWSWGYFVDGAGSRADRIDRFLRACQNVRVRPKVESIDGVSCYVLEAETSNGRYTLWMDPNRGYNCAKLHFEGQGVDMIGLNTAIKRFGAAWVPVKAAWEVRIARPPDFSMSYRHEIRIEKLEIDPNYIGHNPFAMDDVPEGTKTTFLGVGGRPMPGEFLWQDERPLPCVDEGALARLESIADDLMGQAERLSGGVLPSKFHPQGTEEHPEFLLQEGQPSGKRQDPHGSSLHVGSVSADAAVPESRVAPVNRKQPPHCGLYCLYLIMRMEGRQPEFGDLIRPEYLDTSNGSTLTALKLAAEDAGLHAEIMRGLSTRALRSYGDPAILHVKGNELSRDYDHYIVFLAAQGHQAQVYDPPGLMRLIPFDELAARWDGKALVVSNEPVQLVRLIRRERARLLSYAVVPVVLLLLLRRMRGHNRWWEALPRAFGGAGLAGMQAAVLAAVSLVVALICHSVGEAGFLAYPDGVVSTRRAHASDFIRRIDLETAKRLQGEGAVFVDARLKRDFDAGHVEGAISIPVDANDTAYLQAASSLSSEDSLVVYCQSVNCSSADTVAGRLRREGFSAVSILPGGWVEWTTGIRPRALRLRKESEPMKWRLNEDGTASPI